MLLGLAMGWALHVVSIKTQSAAQYKLALVIGANWQLVDLAFRSQPGCVAERPGKAAAKPGC